MLHQDPLFAALTDIRPFFAEYLSLALVTLDDGEVENEADVNFALDKDFAKKLVEGNWDAINFLEVWTDIRAQRGQVTPKGRRDEGTRSGPGSFRSRVRS